MHSEVSVPLPPSNLIVGHVDCVQAEGSGGGGGWMRSSKSPTEPFPPFSHAPNSLKQLRAAEGGNKRKKCRQKKKKRKKSRFSRMDGKVGACQTVVCLGVCVQVCVWWGERLCVPSIFGGGFLSALEEPRVWDTGSECVILSSKSSRVVLEGDWQGICETFVCACMCVRVGARAFNRLLQGHRCSSSEWGSFWEENQLMNKNNQIEWLNERDPHACVCLRIWNSVWWSKTVTPSSGLASPPVYTCSQLWSRSPSPTDRKLFLPKQPETENTSSFQKSPKSIAPRSQMQFLCLK